MKKILFRKLLYDCLLFFSISLISTSLIIWVFQAVNFLDIIVEDGRDFAVYLKYITLNFPKIVSKILPFAVFFSFCYVLSKYELNNELIIFWNFGVHKIELVNFFFRVSIMLMILQVFLTTLVVPSFQNYSRSLIRNSNIDFFESFIKPKKFNDNIRNLTIYADKKSKDGKLKNIYLKKDTGINRYQITVAKNGEFKSVNKSKILILYNGETINAINNKITNFKFTKSDFILSNLDSDIIIQDKIQETSTIKHLNCFRKFTKINFLMLKNLNQNFSPNCSAPNLDNIFKELYKRIIIPLYIPILILISMLLILNSKEKGNYNKLRNIIFFIGIIIIIFSESSLRFVANNLKENLIIIITPLVILNFIYIIFKVKLSQKIMK